ncbi:MAG: metallophosphatase family protein [Flavobacteriaceae bacterium]|nr:metallophosphatase family protein [Flavobacteriaceae bacterium]
MRIGIISDIHGNYEALKAVLKELDTMKVSQIYCLGDVVGYFTQVNECCDELRKRNIPSVMGNHDWYMASNGYCKRSQSVNDYIDYQRSVITKENLDWVKKFNIHRFVGSIHMLHGGWENPIDEYLYEPTEQYFLKLKGNIFMSGHTHIPKIRKFKNSLYCNPGSVGQPRDNDQRAGFAVFDNGKFSLHRAEFDKIKSLELLKKAGFDDEYYSSIKNKK